MGEYINHLKTLFAINCAMNYYQQVTVVLVAIFGVLGAHVLTAPDVVVPKKNDFVIGYLTNASVLVYS